MVFVYHTFRPPSLIALGIWTATGSWRCQAFRLLLNRQSTKFCFYYSTVEFGTHRDRKLSQNGTFTARFAATALGRFRLTTLPIDKWRV